MKIEITKVVEVKSRGRVYFEAVVDGKKKSWSVAKGLFALIQELIKVKP